MLSGILTTCWVVLACGLLWVALVGWGELVRRVLRLDADLGLRGAWGLAALTVLGGPLNLLGGISRPLLVGLLALGLSAGTAALVEARRGPLPRLSPPQVTLALAVALLLLLQLAIGDALDFNPHDDRHAYLVFPVQMVEAGGMLPDPFNLRRLISSLGGQSFLHAFSLTALGIEQLNAVERGLAMLLWLGLLAGHAGARSLRPGVGLGLALGVLLLHVPAVNTSSVLTGVVGFYALLRSFQLVGRPEVPGWSRVLLLALVAAGISTLKTSLIPAAGLFLCAGTVASSSLPWRRRLAELPLVGLLTALGMLPWMLDLLRSSGTLLYPLFGQGYHGSLHGAYPAAYTEASLQVQLANMAVTFTEPLFAALALVAVLPLRGGPPWRYAKAGAVAACLTALVLVVASDGRVRYSFPFAAAALLFLVVEGVALTPAEGAPRWARPPRWGALALTLVCAWGAPQRGQELRGWPGKLVARWAEGGADPFAAERARLARIQATVPAGEALFARLERPFLLEYGRQPIVVLDWPCAVSPPPGLSCQLTPEGIADYLCARGIRYLAYDHASEAGFSLAFGARLAADANYWERISAEHTYVFQDLLIDLAALRPRVHEDDQTFVLALCERP